MSDKKNKNEENKEEVKDGESMHPHSIQQVKDLKKKPPRGGLFSKRMMRIGTEFHKGFQFISKYGLAATVFGSARSGLDDKTYKEATKLAGKLADEGFTIITGGGPGIMEAANKGAYEAGGESVGLCIQLPEEQITNEYVTESISFHYFFTRKVMLSFASELYIFFPGGFGTLDEMFEMITLIQTGKDEQDIPVILIGEDHWRPLLDWIENKLYREDKAISKEDMDIYTLVDSADEALEVIKEEMKNKPELFNDH